MTLKEYMRKSKPELDKIAEKAEVQRTSDEETKYEERKENNYVLYCNSY